jgi:hypothetical protein
MEPRLVPASHAFPIKSCLPPTETLGKNNPAVRYSSGQSSSALSRESGGLSLLT